MPTDKRLIMMKKKEKIIQLHFDFANEVEQTKVSSSLIKNSIFDLLDCFHSPIIVFESAWKDDIPKDLKQSIVGDRMIAYFNKEELATYSEVAAYIMPRTYESPLRSEWVNIYCWCCNQYLKSKNRQMNPNAPETLTDYEHKLLFDLRYWIYNQRRKHLKLTMKKK